MNSHEKQGASPVVPVDGHIQEYQVLKAVNEALTNLLSSANLEEALEHSFRTICKAIGCDGAYLFDYHVLEDDKIISKSCFGIRREKNEWKTLDPDFFEFPLETDLVKTRVQSMLEENTTTIGRRKDCPPKLNDLLASLSVESYLTFRIVIDDSVWGGISFISYKTSVDWALERHHLLVPFVSSVGNYLTRKRTERELIAQRDYLRQVIDSNPNPVYAINQAGSFTMINRAMAKELKFSPEELIGKSIFSIGSDQVVAKQIHEEALDILKSQKPKLDMLREIMDLQGNSRLWQVSKIPIQELDGGMNEVLTVVTDLTPLRQTEQQLLLEKRLSESITSIIPDIILIVDLEQRIFTYNNIACNDDIIGFERREIGDLFEFLNSRLHPEDRNISTGFLEDINKASPHDVIEKYFRLQHKAGHWVYFYERAKVFSRHPDGRIKEYLAILQDITEHVKAQRNLKKSEERYRNFINHSFDGIYYLRFEEAIPLHLPIKDQVNYYYKYGYIEECNQSFARMYGAENPGEVEGLRVLDAHGGDFFEYNKQSTYNFIKNNYRLINSG